MSMLEKQVDKKADDKWATDMFEIQEKGILESKNIALAGRNKFENRVCEKEDDIKEMMRAIQGTKNLKFGVVIAFLIFVIGGGSQFFGLIDTAEDTAETVIKVEKSVKTIKTATEQNAVMFKTHIVQVEKEKIQKKKDKEVENKKDDEQFDKILKAIKKSRRR